MDSKQTFLVILALAAFVAGVFPFASVRSAGAQEGDQPLSGLLVELTRGPLVESRHYGRLVAVTPDGEIKVSVGDPRSLVLSRSALKPLQAVATVKLALEQGVELTTEEIALMCASHGAQSYHLRTAEALLRRAGATEDHLHCGPSAGRRLNHNCSGKHGGMMVQAKIAGDPLDGYWETDHPVQQRIQTALQEFTGWDQPLESGTDGCGVPNYALPLYSIALGYARLANPETAPQGYREAARAIRDAIIAHPGHLSSRGSFDARLMEQAEGRIITKSGAEACYGIGIRGDTALGIAVKIEDGSTRGMQPLLLTALDRLGIMTPQIDDELGRHRTSSITNSRGDVVGEIRAADW